MKETCALQMNVIYLHVDGCVHAMVEVRGQAGVSPCLASCLDTRVSCLLQRLSTAEKLACEALTNLPLAVGPWGLWISSDDLNSGSHVCTMALCPLCDEASSSFPLVIQLFANLLKYGDLSQTDTVSP